MIGGAPRRLARSLLRPIPIFLSVFALASEAFAADIVSVTGTTDPADFISIAPFQTLEASWTASSAYSNVSIAAEVGCSVLGMPCAVGATSGVPDLTAWLTTAVGPSETVANVIATYTFPPGKGPELDTVFSGLTLGAGTYYLVFGDGSVTTYWLGGEGDTAKTLVTGPGVTFNGEGFKNNASDGGLNVANPPASIFISYDAGLHFQVTGDPVASTPEPGFGPILAGAFSGLWFWKRRRGNAAALRNLTRLGGAGNAKAMSSLGLMGLMCDNGAACQEMRYKLAGRQRERGLAIATLP
jgi:hypothetical protein